MFLQIAENVFLQIAENVLTDDSKVFNVRVMSGISSFTFHAISESAADTFTVALCDLIRAHTVDNVKII